MPDRKWIDQRATANPGPPTTGICPRCGTVYRLDHRGVSDHPDDECYRILAEQLSFAKRRVASLERMIEQVRPS